MPTPLKQDSGNSLDLVDIKEIKKNVVIMKDGSMHQVVMVGGVNFALKSEGEQAIITQGYQNFLNGISYPLQIIIHSRKVNIEKYIATLRVRREAEVSPILQNQIDEYINFIDGFVKKNPIMEKAFFVVVPFYPSNVLPGQNSLSGVLPFFGKKKVEKEGAENEGETIFDNNLVQLSQRSSQVMNGLLAIGLEAEILGNEQLIELFYNFYNPQTIEKRDFVTPASDN